MKHCCSMTIHALSIITICHTHMNGHNRKLTVTAEQREALSAQQSMQISIDCCLTALKPLFSGRVLGFRQCGTVLGHQFCVCVCDTLCFANPGKCHFYMSHMYDEGVLAPFPWPPLLMLIWMEHQLIFLQLSATWASPLTRISLFNSMSPAPVNSAIWIAWNQFYPSLPVTRCSQDTDLCFCPVQNRLLQFPTRWLS